MKPYRSSASQVSTAELCLRKWAGLKIEKLDPPPNKYAAYGLRTHKHLDEWFSHGVVPDDSPEGKTAQAILLHLPPPQTPGIEVEKKLTLTLGGIEFVGYVDIRILDREIPFVSDHKTCGSFDWCLEADEMHDDVQATLYAYDAMCLANTDTVKLQWTYGTRHKKPKTKPVRRIVMLDEIKPRLEKTAATAKILEELHHAQPHWLDVPYDAGGCDAFGGCPFQEHCNLSPQEKIQSIMAQGQEHQSFIQKLRAQKLRNGKGTAPATHPPPELPEALAIPTDKGTVNPHTAPATAEVAPPPEPSKPAAAPKKRRGRPPKTEAQKKADAVVKAKPIETAPETVETHGERALKIVQNNASNVAEALEVYRKGFLDGFREGRGA